MRVKFRSSRSRLNRMRANKSIWFLRCRPKHTELWATSLSEWLPNKPAEDSTSGLMLSTKKTKSVDSCANCFYTGNADRTELDSEDGQKLRSRFERKNCRRSSNVKSKDAETCKSSVKPKNAPMQTKPQTSLVRWPSKQRWRNNWSKTSRRLSKRWPGACKKTTTLTSGETSCWCGATTSDRRKTQWTWSEP